MMTGRRYQNEYNLLIPIGGIVGLSIGISMGIYYGSINSILMGFSLGFISFSVLFYSVFGRTPKYVEITNGGIRLVYLFGKERRIGFDELEYLVVHPPDPPQWRKRYNVGGFAKPRKGRIFLFTRRIGYALKEAYREEVGHYPPEKPDTMVRGS